MSRHIGELAELYALSSLDERERAVVERHVQGCLECANRIRDSAESFASRLALARAEQKALSLKVISTAMIVGFMIILGG